MSRIANTINHWETLRFRGDFRHRVPDFRTSAAPAGAQVTAYAEDLTDTIVTGTILSGPDFNTPTQAGHSYYDILTTDGIHRCLSSTVVPTAVFTRSWHVVDAAGHILAGGPTATEEDVQEALAYIEDDIAAYPTDYIGVIEPLSIRQG